MRIESEIYGVFYKDGKEWKFYEGPISELILKSTSKLEDAPIENHIEWWLKGRRKTLKKKVKMFKLIWKSVKS